VLAYELGEEQRLATGDRRARARLGACLGEGYPAGRRARLEEAWKLRERPAR
jgi:hypothetical protein